MAKNDENWSKYVMLRQGMESYPIKIWSYAQNRDDNKHSEDLAVDWYTNLHTGDNGGCSS